MGVELVQVRSTLWLGLNNGPESILWAWKLDACQVHLQKWLLLKLPLSSRAINHADAGAQALIGWLLDQK